MIKNEAIQELVNKGIVESQEYYHNVELNIFPLLDYLKTDQIKQLYKWLNNTYDKMNKDEENTVGIEYVIAVKSYLSGINTRTGTAYTQ
tara:strand:+ start:173 stop:439 length:267 start_codon:yes stop_codon:yes gene_type:complete